MFDCDLDRWSDDGGASGGSAGKGHASPAEPPSKRKRKPKQWMRWDSTMTWADLEAMPDYERAARLDWLVAYWVRKVLRR